MSGNMSSFTPFFVADRQASLRILAGLRLPYGKKYGIMTHANTSLNFKQAFRAFPCVCAESCSVIGGLPCFHQEDMTKCRFASNVKDSVLKICDSGVFQKKGCAFTSYEDLFQRYRDLGTDYGIIMDFLKEKDRTLETAQDAINVYKSNREQFKLIGVAQGNSVEEYIDCYVELQRMGYKHIAVGGMLQRKEKSARYVHVKDETILKDSLKAIRKIDPNGWLFALGCYSPGRHNIFLENSVFGADYKGWIFQYDGKSRKRGDLRSQNARFKQVRSFIEDDILIRPQTWKTGTKLLIVSCSKRKAPYKGEVQAINLYDGPLYRMLRKNVQSFSNEDGLDIMIMSAKYGLIEPTKLIKNYDVKMTPDRANELIDHNCEIIKAMVEKKQYTDVLVNLGKDYRESIEPALNYFQAGDVNVLKGPIGTRLSSTKKWLFN